MSTDPTEPKGPEPTPESPVEPPAEQAPKHHDDIIADLRREVSDLKDKYLRAHAEMDNIRKRAEREKDETAKYAITRFARDMLNVGDNFQRALASVPAGAADADATLKSLVDGVSMSEREFNATLERNGVKRIEAMGQPFNPHLHQAVMEMAKADVPSGTVVQVFQAGYVIDERTLRPAMVVVSTGGPKPSAEPPAAPADAPPAEPDKPAS